MIGFLNRVFLVISVILKETTFSISDLTGVPVLMEYEIVRVVSLSTNEVSDVTQLKI